MKLKVNLYWLQFLNVLKLSLIIPLILFNPLKSSVTEGGKEDYFLLLILGFWSK